MPIQPNWGAQGHATVNRVAAEKMSSDMPAFFSAAADQLVEFGGQPDRWKIDGLPQLAASNVPDHSIMTELVPSYPPTREGYNEMLVDKNIGKPGQRGFSAGYLPYRISEGFERLVADFALWRHETSAHGPDTALAQELQADAISTGGLLGHFCGDASQPLHTTVHRDGWVEAVQPNPDHYRTTPGIHFEFETTYVNNGGVNTDEVRSKVGPPQDLQGNILDLATAFIETSHQSVPAIYELDKQGLLAQPNPQATALVDDRLAAGAQLLRDLWTTAWHRSEAVVGQIHDPS
ncbi:MAG TPA: hypothetical protein VGO93_20530 [Candidatus Xenobia bacterium]|jgi:hypothetical protein